jgi:aryl-alcohol dehydrogenase (NADP+)
MRTRILPGTDLAISEVCLGTMTWGEQTSEREAHAQLARALDLGINFVDTAEMYPAPPRAETQGRTEAYLGRWLAAHGRQGLVIASKVAGPGRRDWIRGGRTDLTREVIAEACDTSLERLRIDCIDLYQIHWPQRNVPRFGARQFDPSQEREGPGIAEQAEAMGALVRAGKIRHWGLSNETAWGVCAFRQAAKALGVPPPVTVQNGFNLVARGAEYELAETLYREQVSLLAYTPLGGGMLTGKYLEGARPSGARFTEYSNFTARFGTPLAREAIDAYAALARERGVSLASLALGYLRSRWFVAAMIVGATSVDQLEANVAAARTELDAETLAGLAALFERHPSPWA